MRVVLTVDTAIYARGGKLGSNRAWKQLVLTPEDKHPACTCQETLAIGFPGKAPWFSPK